VGFSDPEQPLSPNPVTSYADDIVGVVKLSEAATQ
jgi:hypothetical protein